MNEKQHCLYDNLLALTKEEPKIFYYCTLCVEDVHYRVFNYRYMPDYSKWLINESALECRGITFEMDSDNNLPVSLASWPFEKFFNLNECFMTQNLDVSSPTEILVKEDGSLITTVLLPSGALKLKSKTSFTSDQANAANELIGTPQWRAFYEWTLDWSSRGFTVIMEFVSPFNKIVIPHSQSTLTVLGIRNNKDGSYVDLFDMDMPLEIQKFRVKNIASEIDDAQCFVQSIQEMTEVEGYVIRLPTGQRVKIKTEWYKNLHNLRRQLDVSDLALAKLVADQKIDDLRSAHTDSPEVLKRIDEITFVVSETYNDIITATTVFYENNKRLDRRDYALLAKEALTKQQMGIAMRLYSGKDVDFYESVFQQLKKDGIKRSK